MKKKNSLKMIAAVTEILCYIINLIIIWLIFGFKDKTVTFWIGFAATTVAFFEAFITSVLHFGVNSAKSRFYAAPSMYLIAIWAIVFIVYGYFMMIFKMIGIKFSASSFAVLLIINAIMILRLQVPKVFASEVSENIRSKVATLKDLEIKVTSMITSDVRDPELREMLESLADDVKYSDPMSDPSLDQLERRISSECDTLSTMLDIPEDAKSKCETISKLLKQRNEKALLLK